jgi:hypothetical protein
VTVVCVCISSLRPLWIRLRGGSSSSGYQDHAGHRSKSEASYGLEHLSSKTHKRTWEVSHGRGVHDADTESTKGGLTNGTTINYVQEFSVAYEDAESSASTRNDVEAQITIKTVI